MQDKLKLSICFTGLRKSGRENIFISRYDEQRTNSKHAAECHQLLCNVSFTKQNITRSPATQHPWEGFFFGIEVLDGFKELLQS